MTTVTVRSENSLFQKLVVLKTNRVKRGRYGEFLVEGVRNLNAAVRYCWKIAAVVYPYDRRLSDWAKDFINACGADRIEMKPELMEKLSGKTDTSELMAVAGMKDDDPERISFSGVPLLALFDRPSNHGNLGTVIRSCDSCGVDGLIITGHAADLYAPEVVTATMGSFFKVPCVRMSSNEEIESYIGSLRSRYPDLVTVGTTAHMEKPLWDVDLTRPAVFFIGNETDGLSSFLKTFCDVQATIPMAADSFASSFNVACSATVMFSEAMRQRRQV